MAVSESLTQCLIKHTAQRFYNRLSKYSSHPIVYQSSSHYTGLKCLWRSPHLFLCFGFLVATCYDLWVQHTALFISRFHVQKRPAHSKFLPVCDVGVRFNMKEGENKLNKW